MSRRTDIKILCALEAAGELKQPVTRRFWVHPYFVHRESSDRFVKFYEGIRKYAEIFFGYYRMSVKSFDELLNTLRPYITKQQTPFRNPISAEERLTITLR